MNYCCEVERHRPARKGLRRYLYDTFATQLSVERHRPARKGLRLDYAQTKQYGIHGRKTSPCSKGIETMANWQNYRSQVSKDIALLERD